MPQNFLPKGQSSQGTANTTTTSEIPHQPKSSSQPNPTPTLSTMWSNQPVSSSQPTRKNIKMGAIKSKKGKSPKKGGLGGLRL